jgi:hypothetical protein
MNPKPSTFASPNEAALHPEESIALRRRSSGSNSFDDEGDNFSELSDILEFGQPDAAFDGGREAWKALFAAWLVDFMTSGKRNPCYYSQLLDTNRS